VTIEAYEILCKQGDDCEEMYVVISGSMTGYSYLGDVDAKKEPTVKRRMTKGDSITCSLLRTVLDLTVSTVNLRFFLFQLSFFLEVR